MYKTRKDENYTEYFKVGTSSTYHYLSLSPGTSVFHLLILHDDHDNFDDQDDDRTKCGSMASLLENREEILKNTGELLDDVPTLKYSV